MYIIGPAMGSLQYKPSTPALEAPVPPDEILQFDPPGPARKSRMPRTPVIDRLLSKIAVNPFTGCWTYTGSAGTPDGYKKIATWDENGKFKSDYVHRVSYEHFVRPLEPGEQIDHLCKNRSCACPSHLEAVSAHENWRRSEAPSAQNARKTTCKRGHTLDDAYISKEGYRACRTCVQAASRKRYRSNKLTPSAPITTAPQLLPAAA